MSTPEFTDTASRRILRVKFWEGFEADVDVADVANRSLSVKGTACPNPLRFLEIYSDSVDAPTNHGGFSRKSESALPRQVLSYEDVKKRFFPSIPGRAVEISGDVHLPPFCWREADAGKLCVSFTYNANAFYRILKNLSAEGKIGEAQIGNLLDRACLILAQIYKAGGHHVIKHINNNFNMYLISRVIEELLGADVYSCAQQELGITSRSLAEALRMAPAFSSYSILEKMGLALGMGVAFIEERLQSREGFAAMMEGTQRTAHQYFGQRIAIDDRLMLLRLIGEADVRQESVVLAVILDDAAETVFDFLWIQGLMARFPRFRVDLLVNSAQISINFSIHMLETVLRNPCFKTLSSEFGRRLQVTKMYCPFISFQTNYLPENARRAIAAADLLYVKGANFFETCQIPEKNRFHAFVVFGPISRSYTGLNDYDAVFVHLPPGTPGYTHDCKPEDVVTLKVIAENRVRH